MADQNTTRQINVDLEKFSDNTNKYRDVLQDLGQSFKLDWKVIMPLLNQTLPSKETEAALGAAQELGDTWYLSEVHDLMMPEERDSIEGQLILKNKFITQSEADTRRKLQKLALGPEQCLTSSLNLASLVFYNRDQKKQAESNRRDQKKATAALVMALRQTDLRGSNEGRLGFTSPAELVTSVV
ncbi:hypothetical protein AAY473_023923 [Plecturocebus cupreus]